LPKSVLAPSIPAWDQSYLIGNNSFNFFCNLVSEPAQPGEQRLHVCRVVSLKVFGALLKQTLPLALQKGQVKGL
jgi:hypothetical protein